jgi:hypothetical protein
MKYISIIFATMMTTSAYSAETSENELAEARLNAQKEIAMRNLENESSDFRNMCDRDEDKVWCEAFISAVITHLEVTGASTCIPVNDVGRFDFDGVWTLTKAWLYQQPATQRVTFFNAIIHALTGTEECNF